MPLYFLDLLLICLIIHKECSMPLHLLLWALLLPPILRNHTLWISCTMQRSSVQYTHKRSMLP